MHNGPRFSGVPPSGVGMRENPAPTGRRTAKYLPEMEPEGSNKNRNKPTGIMDHNVRIFNKLRKTHTIPYPVPYSSYPFDDFGFYCFRYYGDSKKKEENAQEIKKSNKLFKMLFGPNTHINRRVTYCFILRPR